VCAYDARLQEHDVQIGDVGLRYAEGPPSGPSLVMLHGGSNRWQRWASILEPLTERWHVFAPDLRGHGGSSWTPGEYTIRSFADDIVAFLERVVGEPVVLFGHSLGGEVAVWTAALRPSHIRAIVVEDAPFSGSAAKPTILSQREQLDFQRRYAGSKMRPAELASLMPGMPFGRDDRGRSIQARHGLGERHPEYLEWAKCMIALDPTFIEALSDYDLFSAGYEIQLLTRIACPVLLLRAGREGAMSIAEAESALQLLGDGRLVTLDDLGHGMHWQAPDLVVQTVMPFLEEIRGSQPWPRAGRGMASAPP